MPSRRVASVDIVRGAVMVLLAIDHVGRVPLFYHLLHIPLIHLLALGYDAVRHPAPVPWMFDNHPAMVGPAPDGSVWGLRELYLMFVVAMVLLTFACRWYAGVKQASTSRWLKYL